MSKQRAFFHRATIGVLNTLLPDRIKRMIFISSLAAHIKEVSNPDKVLIGKLNKLLELSSSDGALKLPMSAHQRIWHNLEPNTIYASTRQSDSPLTSLSELQSHRLPPQQLRIVSEQIIKFTPDWLRYGSNRQIRSDLMRLFSNMGELSTT